MKITDRIAKLEASHPSVASDALDRAHRAVFGVLWAMQDGKGTDGINALAARIRADTLTDNDRRILGMLPADALRILGVTAAEFVQSLGAAINSGKV